jgi:hypothetical protein
MVSMGMTCCGTPMKNIEHFNLYTARIFNVLLDTFPMQKALDAKEIAEAMKNVIPIDPQKAGDASCPSFQNNRDRTATIETKLKQAFAA